MVRRPQGRRQRQCGLAGAEATCATRCGAATVRVDACFYDSPLDPLCAPLSLCAWQDLFELPSTSTYTTVQTSKYSSHQTVESAAAADVPAQAPPSDIGLAGVIAVLCSGTDMYKYKSGAGRRRHIRHFQIRGIGEDAALTWRSPGWLSLRKERSVLLRDVVAMHHARGDLEWLRCAAPEDGCASRARYTHQHARPHPHPHPHPPQAPRLQRAR